jgi:spermidine/putrescine transport system ATP-binding protein
MAFDVEFRNVTKRFGDHVAVNDISFAVPPGSFFSLLGPSGCGKTTTLRMASGFEWPDAGEILIGGDDMSRVAPYARPTNMVFQRWALFPHMTVFDNVAFGLTVERRPASEIRKRVGEALELVGLATFANRKPRQLSGGQMQRVALARALVKKPKVLLLDEPLGALDLRLRLQMQIELKRIQAEVGTTFIYVTHDQGEALTMSDRIAVMNNGRIEQLDSPQVIYDRPASRFVAGFIGNTNLVPAEVVAVANGAATGRMGALEFASPVVVPPKGNEVMVSIRYERVRVGPDAAGGGVIARAKVLQTIFSGSTVHYVVRLESAPVDLTIEAPHDGTSPPLAEGAVVDVSWDGAATGVFDDG